MGGGPFITKTMVHQGGEEGLGWRMVDCFEDQLRDKSSG